MRAGGVPVRALAVSVGPIGATSRSTSASASFSVSASAPGTSVVGARGTAPASASSSALRAGVSPQSFASCSSPETLTTPATREPSLEPLTMLVMPPNEAPIRKTLSAPSRFSSATVAAARAAEATRSTSSAVSTANAIRFSLGVWAALSVIAKYAVRGSGSVVAHAFQTSPGWRSVKPSAGRRPS